MKKYLNIAFAFLFLLVVSVTLVACGGKNDIVKAKTITVDNVEYTFENKDLKVSRDGNTYKISGTAELLSDDTKTAFGMPTNYMVALKLTANKDVVKAEVTISITADLTTTANGDNMDGSDFIYLILDVEAGKTYTIVTKWNSDDKGTTYTIKMASNLILES